MDCSPSEATDSTLPASAGRKCTGGACVSRRAQLVPDWITAAYMYLRRRAAARGTICVLVVCRRRRRRRVAGKIQQGEVKTLAGRHVESEDALRQ